MNSIVEFVASHASSNPDKLCLVDPARQLTYRQVWAHVVACAGALRELGVAKGSYVAIECNQAAEFPIAMLATQLLKATVVPVEKNASSSRRLDIAGKVSPSVFVGPKPSEEFAQAAFACLGDVCLNGGDGLPVWDDGFPETDSDAEILFSTGTTGVPKGVVLTHANDVAMSRNIIAGLQMKPTTVELILVPLNHAFGLRRLNANLANGTGVIIANGVLAMKQNFNLMDEYHANAMALSANTLSVVFKLTDDALGRYADVMDYVQLSSAVLPEQDKDKLMGLLPSTRLYNFYGSTESGATCLYDFNAMDDKPHSIGKPIGNARFIVVDDDRNPIESSIDNMGILASASDTNMRCYFEDPELTRETMEDGFVYSKDLGYIDEEGFVYVLGRADDVINYGGVKVAPEEIEHEVDASPIVRECACVAMKDELSGQVPALFIVLEEGAQYDAKEFQRFLASVLGINERPRRVEVIDEIPRTYNGKVKRRELVELLG